MKATGRQIRGRTAKRERSVAMQQLLQDVEACTECPTLRPHRKFPATVHGTPAYGLVLIGEAPGRVSLEHGRPFSNPRSRVLRDAFCALHHPCFRQLEDVFYLTDVVKCHPSSADPGSANRSPSIRETRTCTSRFLVRELAVVAPRAVVAVGRLATEAVLGSRVRMAAVHGRWMSHPAGFQLLPLMHPSPRNRRALAEVGMAEPAAYRRYLSRQFARLLRDGVRRLGSR
jgi:uracil-DNA glycosylase family 4